MLLCVRVQCCFTSPETVGTIGDREPKTSTSTFIQLMSCGRAVFDDDLGLNVLRCRAGILATTFEDVP